MKPHIFRLQLKKPHGGCLLKYQYLFEKQLSLRAPSKILAENTLAVIMQDLI